MPKWNLNDGVEVRFAFHISSPSSSILSGETVTKEEQANLQDVEETLPTTQSSMSLSTAVPAAVSPSLATTTVVAADVRSTNVDEWEKERTALYQQLDEKVIDLIQANVDREWISFVF